MMCQSLIVFLVLFSVVLAGIIPKTEDDTSKNGKIHSEICSEDKLTQECKDACIKRNLTPCSQDSDQCSCTQPQKLLSKNGEKEHEAVIYIKLEKTNPTDLKNMAEENIQTVGNQQSPSLSNIDNDVDNNYNDDAIKASEATTQNKEGSKSKENNNSRATDQSVTNHDSNNTETTALIVYSPPINPSNSTGQKDVLGADTAHSSIKNESVVSNHPPGGPQNNVHDESMLKSLKMTDIKIKPKKSVKNPDEDSGNIVNSKTVSNNEKNITKFFPHSLADSLKQEQDSSESEEDSILANHTDEDNGLLMFDKPEENEKTAPKVVDKYLTSNSQLHSLISNQTFIMSAVLVYISFCMLFLYMRSYRKRSYMRVPLLNNFDEANEL